MQPLQYDLLCPAATDNSIPHAAAPSNFGTAITTNGNTRWQQSCSSSNAICNHRFKNRTELRSHEQPHVAEHRGRTDSTMKRAQPHPPHTQGTLHPLQTWENMLTNYYRSVDEATPIRFTMSSCKRQKYYACSRGTKQPWRSNYTAISRYWTAKHYRTTRSRVRNCTSKTDISAPKKKNTILKHFLKIIFKVKSPAPQLRKSADKSLSQPWCSHPNTIYNVQLQKTIVLRMPWGSHYY